MKIDDFLNNIKDNIEQNFSKEEIDMVPNCTCGGLYQTIINRIRNDLVFFRISFEDSRNGINYKIFPNTEHKGILNIIKINGPNILDQTIKLVGNIPNLVNVEIRRRDNQYSDYDFKIVGYDSTGNKILDVNVVIDETEWS